MTADEMIAVIQAWKDGKKIQYRNKRSITSELWCDVELGSAPWAFDVNNYRVKPEPREFWINVYADGSQSRLWQSSEACIQAQDITKKLHERLHLREVLE